MNLIHISIDFPGQKILHQIACITISIFWLLFLFGCAPKKVNLLEPVPNIRDEIVQSATSLLGKPYKSGGKGPESFDCSGFVYYVYKRSNITLAGRTEILIKQGDEISKADILPGDLVFFSTKKDLHVGIMINKKDFIHASMSKGISIDDLEAPHWQKSLLGFRYVLKIENSSPWWDSPIPL